MKTRENKRLLKAVGKRIRALRKQHGISQAQLGFECGVHGEYIGRIERGIQSPTIITLDSMAKAFEISLEEFFSEGFD
ncbi:MAG TPA: helix-turn-helix transcriptional regulator [Bacteroidia bacterium]|nr:helix-turn-helix transcriptional regulator [Bacteroidia bacterium]